MKFVGLHFCIHLNYLHTYLGMCWAGQYMVTMAWLLLLDLYMCMATIILLPAELGLELFIFLK